jgi:hypothetical protein
MTYVCENPACTLGSRVSPGRFTGGITQEQAFMITGEESAPHGDGYCPNCGDKGREQKKSDFDSVPAEADGSGKLVAEIDRPVTDDEDVEEGEE